ncbi:MAG: hypothetical protein ACM3O4_02800 [Ignavibacteriales bacterium]
MEKGNYSNIINILMSIIQDEELADIVFVSGGIVPWLVSKKDSKRNHSDIDLLVLQENMLKVRKFLRKYNLYDASLDSLNYEDAEMVDYGVDTYIRDIPVGFYPYEQISDELIVQRSFSSTDVSGRKDLKVKEIPNMKVTDYLAKTTLPNGSVIGISSLEVVKVTKEKAGREKDIYDIKEINRIGYDADRYERVKSSINNMKSTLDDRSLGRSR